LERIVRLGPLADADAAKLLRAHVPDLTATEIARAIAVGHGNPRRLLRAAGDIQAGLTPKDSADRGLADAATTVAGPLAGAIVEYISVHGPAAASNATMLRHIGTSRQRASQLMHQLESAGLLRTVEQHEPGRRGRPARRFALKDPA
jgi:hypothetical protein